MTTTAIVDIVCALFMGILYARCFVDRGVSRSNRLLNLCLMVMLLSLLIDASAYMFVGPEYAVPFRFFINLLAFVASCVNVILFTYYTEEFINEKTEINSWVFRIIKVVEFVWAFATAYEFIAGHLITYGTNGVENLDYSFPTYIVVLNLAIQIYLLLVVLINARKIGNMAFLLAAFFVAPIFTSILFSFVGIDLAYAFGALTLGLVAEFIQKKQTYLIKEEQQKQIQEAYDEVSEANIRNEMLYKISNVIKWSYEVSAEDEIISYGYAEHAEEVVCSEGFRDNPMAWAQNVHPDDRDAAINAFEAAIHDHSGETKYDSTYRIMGTEGKYIWLKVSGRMHRRKDGTGEMFGVSMNITDQMEEQQKRLLGAVPMTPDILSKANIGLWAFELDEGQPPRMYGDETMIKLVGLDHQVPPEEMYHAWYDNIDEGSYDLVTDAVSKMSSGEHAEVQYPWHDPDGHSIMVRCGGVRNYEYTKGIRIEGTHQDVTQTLHYDEEERQRAKQMENDLIISKLRADSLAYISDNEPDIHNAINFFGQKILEIFRCDQVIFREMNGHRIVVNAPGINDISQETCSECLFSDIKNDVYTEEESVLMNNCREGYHGMNVHPECPAKSSFMQRIYSGGELVGLFTVHYLNDYHTFSENGIGIMKIVATYLGLLILRIKEKQANIARIEAESSNKAKTEFLFNMSHDIRTPMNAILGYTNIALKHSEESERVNDSLKKIKTSGGHLLNLINDILEMSRIEAGKLEIVNSPINIHEVTEGVIYMSQALAAPKDITFSASIGKLANPYILADELHTNQVIINLISNAIKYTNPGGRVDYGIEQISEPVDGIANYQVIVKDNGIGMSEEFQKHLFESFAREQSTTVSKQEGAGLGLAIVKSIIDLIGGQIHVQSKQGIGTTVTVDFPLQVMDESAINEFVATRNRAQETKSNISFEGKKVLLVEDNELNREIAVDILTEEGIIVEEAEDGTEAVELLKRMGPDHYDFILMDIQMPIMNGYETTKAIRRMYPDMSVPILALSANAFAEDREKSLAAGMDGHVAKPIEIKELFSALEKFS